MAGAVRRAVRLLSEREGVEADCPDEVVSLVAQGCGGDVRKALNAVELLFTAAPRIDGKVVTLAGRRARRERSAMRYDREGDEHYDVVSALMKSLRGSDPDAALHYLARLLEAGDLPRAKAAVSRSASD